jgi:hypothetical protein
MSNGFDSHEINLMASALEQAVDRLRMLKLVGGDFRKPSATLTRLIIEAVERGERSQENLVLYAMGRFQTDGPSQPGNCPSAFSHVP